MLETDGKSWAAIGVKNPNNLFNSGTLQLAVVFFTFLYSCSNKRMKLTSLSDLQQLLPETERRLSSSRDEGNSPHNGKGKSVRVFLETQGRKGKSVTIVAGLQHNPSTMEEIAKILKQHCGAGGTVKQGNIEIQGDQRTRVKEKLRGIGYVPNE